LLDSLEPEPDLDLSKKLADAMTRLTQAQSEVIQLCFYQNMTQEAAAKKLGLSRASVQDRLNGALKKLRKYMS
jgi:RNA polymerase sigma factor (sigma-70 family)